MTAQVQQDMDHFINELKMRFPRLQEVSFTESDKDEYKVETTPAGQVGTVYFYERTDFENAVIALAYKLEPRPIPPSMGAIMISGIIDHVSMEKTAIIILSRGGYSGISAARLKDSCWKYGRKSIGMDSFGNIMDSACDIEDISEEKWEAFSLTIRKYHELEHFVQRQLCPEKTDALKNEIEADMAGIVKTFGVYDGFLARLFLGIEGSSYRRGGRLENYMSQSEDIETLSAEAEKYITSLESGSPESGGIDPKWVNTLRRD